MADSSRRKHIVTLVALLLLAGAWIANHVAIDTGDNAYIALVAELEAFGYDPEQVTFLGGESSTWIVGKRVRGRFLVQEATGRVLEVRAVRPWAFSGWQVRGVQPVNLGNLE